MPETSKIAELEPQGTFEHNGKTFYKFECVLENGTSGEVNTLSASKWSVGDEVDIIDYKETKWGARLKLDRPRRDWSPGPNFGPPAKKDDDTTRGIVASWAVGCAMQAAGDPTQEGYDSIVLQLSRLALAARGVIKKEVEL